MKNRLEMRVFSKPGDGGAEASSKDSGGTDSLGLLNKQEQMLAVLARKFVDESKPEEALELVKRSKVFFASNLVTLTLISTQLPKRRTEISELFDLYVQKARSFNELMDVLRFVKHPKRKFLHRFSTVLEIRMRELDPAWDGAVDTRQKDQMDEKLRLLQLPVEEITDPKTCLELMGFAVPAEKQKYIQRFLDIGGDKNNPRFLRMRLNNILHGLEDVSEAPSLLQALGKQIKPVSLRVWIRNNTKAEKKIPPRFARVMLAAYVGSEPHLLEDADWLYLAERSIQLQEVDLQRICFERLKIMPRNERVQKVFKTLLKRFGSDAEQAVPRLYTTAPYVNPVYEGGRVPVNKATALAVARWARAALGE